MAAGLQRRVSPHSLNEQFSLTHTYEPERVVATLATALAA